VPYLLVTCAGLDQFPPAMKAVIGCLVVVAVLAIGGAVGAYFFVWRPAKVYVAEFAKLKEIPQLNQQVKKTAAFNAPADNVLAASGVERFLRTQQAIQSKLGTRLDELAAKYRTLSPTPGSERRPSLTELTSALKDLAGLIVEAKRMQVDSLNQNDFSLAEYEWTRQRIYEASGLPVDMTVANALRSIAEGKSAEATPATAASAVVPEKNRELVAPHVRELGERAALAAFGL